MASRRSSQHLQRFRLLAELKMIMGSPRQQFLRRPPSTDTTTDTQLQQISIPLATKLSTVLTLVKETSPRIQAASLPATVGEELELIISAKDHCGLAAGPQTSMTEPWRLRVVSPEVLLAMLEAREVILRRRFESLIADFQQNGTKW